MSESYQITKEDLSYYTNHLSESNPNYHNLNIYSYWISSSHNTYLPYGQIWDESNTCYYKLILNLYFGGCIEIDTDGVSKDNQDIIITHLPTNSKQIRLSNIFKIVVDSIRTKIAKGIKSGPIILTFDNKKLVKKEQHEVFWKVLEKELLNKDNYMFVSTLTDDYDLTKIPISALSNKILLRWGENKNCTTVKGKDGKDVAAKGSDKIGKDLCPPPSFSQPNFSYIKTNTSKRWIHLKKGHVDLKSSITNGSNNTVSVSVPLSIKQHPPNYNLVVNTQSNIMRVYPHFSYTMSQNYDNMIFFRDGVQITALNLQYLSDSWYLNSAVFMPAYGISCSPAKTKQAQSVSDKCFNGWDKSYLQPPVPRDEPLAYRLKPLWSLGLLPWPKMHTLTLKIVELHKISETGKNASNDIDEYPILNVVYGLDKRSFNATKKGQEIKINNVDPTVPFFVVEVVKSGSFGIGLSKAFSKVNMGSKYKGGVEISWDANKLKGVIYTTLHKIRRTISGNYNKVDLDDNCETSSMFNSRKQIEAVISFEWTPSHEIPEIKPYNDAIIKLRTSDKYKSKTVADFLGSDPQKKLELMNNYQHDLRQILLGKTFHAPQEQFIDDDAEAAHYDDQLKPLLNQVVATNDKQFTDE